MLKTNMTTFRQFLPFVLLVALAALPACTISSGPPKLLEAVLARGLGQNREPVNPSTEFNGTEKVCISFKFDERPAKGVVVARFMLKDQLIAENKVDFSDVNKGMIISFGQVTYAGFDLTPKEPLPISDEYRVEATLDGKPLGSWPFKVIPPAGATPALLHSAVLARGATEEYQPVDATDVFSPTQTVYLVGTADLGVQSWMQVDWYEDGAMLKEGTSSFTSQENKPNVPFSFRYRPQNGWKPGRHEVVMTINGKVAGKYGFSVVAEDVPNPTETPAPAPE